MVMHYVTLRYAVLRCCMALNNELLRLMSVHTIVDVVLLIFFSIRFSANSVHSTNTNSAKHGFGFQGVR